MILINNFEIINNGSQLAIDVETNIEHTIKSISLWKMSDFKDYSLAINLNSHLLNINNKEVLIIDAKDVELYKFEDIYFIEIESTYIEVEGCQDCQTTAIGITYNLSKYYTCLLNYLTNLQLAPCVTCNKDENKQMVITVNMLIDTVIKSLEVGYYTQAIDMIAKLKKLCALKNCDNCPTIECASCNNFIQS